MLRTREPDSIAVGSYDAGKVISKRAASLSKEIGTVPKEEEIERLKEKQ